MLQIAALLLLVLNTCYGENAMPSNGELRLVRNGKTSYRYTSGRLQIYLDGQWGNICDKGFGMTEATVACRQLTYKKAVSFGRGRYGHNENPALLDAVSCSGRHLRHLLRCDFTTVASCTQRNQVSISCDPEHIWQNTLPFQIRLQNGSYPSQGRVEFFETSGWNTLCKQNFDEAAAAIACRQLGYTGVQAQNQLHLPGFNRKPLTNYGCCPQTATHSYFSNCLCPNTANKVCDHNDDATLQCNFEILQKDQTGLLSQRSDIETRQYDYYYDTIPIPAIAGAVVGGVILVVLTIVYIVLYVKFPAARPYLLLCLFFLKK